MTSENPYRAPEVTSDFEKPAPLVTPPARNQRKTSWLLSFLAAAGSLYGPYTVMTVYTQFYVSCDHCQKATRDLLLCSPALLPVELAQRTLGLPRQADWIWFSVSFSITLLWLTGLALLLRQSKILGAVAAAITLSLGSFLAMALLAMIRM